MTVFPGRRLRHFATKPVRWDLTPCAGGFATKPVRWDLTPCAGGGFFEGPQPLFFSGRVAIFEPSSHLSTLSFRRKPRGVRSLSPLKHVWESLQRSPPKHIRLRIGVSTTVRRNVFEEVLETKPKLQCSCDLGHMSPDSCRASWSQMWFSSHLKEWGLPVRRSGELSCHSFSEDKSLATSIVVPIQQIQALELGPKRYPSFSPIDNPAKVTACVKLAFLCQTAKVPQQIWRILLKVRNSIPMALYQGETEGKIPFA